MGNMVLIIDDDEKLRNLYVNAADAMPTGGDLYLKTVNVTDKDMIGNPNIVKNKGIRSSFFTLINRKRGRRFQNYFLTSAITGLERFQ